MRTFLNPICALYRNALTLNKFASAGISRTRMMSTDSGASRHKFVVYAPDMTDPGAFQRRLSVRPTHLERAGVQSKKGIIRLGGSMLTPESIESPNAEKKMIGSVLICEADSLKSVRELMESDVYYTSGVWDKEKLVILPFVPADLPLPE